MIEKYSECGKREKGGKGKKYLKAFRLKIAPFLKRKRKHFFPPV